ncbi:MAG: glycoside hydrolase family 28 protein [Eubacteriales bacterium]|nr:glycoside hydrolase family 28 protein [Eubacteriales bacterium]
MELKLVNVTGRSAVVELTDSGKYYTENKYEIYLDGSKYMESDKVITSIYGLLPDTEYKISAVYNNQIIEAVTVKTNYEYVTLNVRDFGAYGDGEHDDTNAIQCAIMSCPKDSRVLVPEGIYKISSIFLKNDLTLEIAKNAVLSAFTEREKFPILPGTIESNDETKEYNLGSWEGNPLDCFSAILCGINCNNVVITGEGTIDGCTTFENWWNNCKVRDIAWRPRLFFINHCNNVTMHGITVQNSPSWTLHPYFSNHLKFIDVKIINPANSHNTDGLDPESCHDVLVLGTYISVGDDCIAIKSGKIYMAKKYQTPTSNMIVRQCCMRDGHGAVTVGSEIAAGVNDVHIKDCLFMNTDRGLRVKTRRGRGKLSVLDDISFEDIDMDNVMTPFVVNSFYFCDPDGKTEYVGSRNPLPVDDRTPSIKRLTFKNIKASNCHVAGAYICGLPESKIDRLTFENIDFEYAKDAKSGVAAMMLGCDEGSRQGLIVSNVKELVLKNVNINGCEGDKIVQDNVDSIIAE